MSTQDEKSFINYQDEDGVTPVFYTKSWIEDHLSDNHSLEKQASVLQEVEVDE